MNDQSCADQIDTTADQLINGRIDVGEYLRRYNDAARAHQQAMKELRRILRARRRRDSIELLRAEVDAAGVALRTLHAFAEIKQFRVEDHKDYLQIRLSKHYFG